MSNAFSGHAGRHIRADGVRDAERWRFVSLADERGGNGSDAAMIDLRQSDGYRLGFKEGYETGRQRGAQEGRQAGEPQMAAVRAIAANMQAQFARLEHDVAERLVSLSFAIAQNLLRGELQQRPEAIVEVVQAMLKELHTRLGNARLRLHPQDAALLPPAITEELALRGCRVETDDAIARGGGILEADELEIDATLGKRWEQVLAAMGYTARPV